VLHAVVAAGAVAAAFAWTVPLASAAAEVSADGTAAGELAKGSTIQVRLQVTDSAGWQRIEEIAVSLRLRGQPLDQVVVAPSAFSIAVVNAGPPVSIGEPGTLHGPYFKLDNSKVTVSAKGNEYDLTFPLVLGAEPPAGARLYLSASDTSGVAADDVAMTPPVTSEDQGFPWGTIGLAVAAALFLGAFVGNTFSTRRARARPNVYATVARRLDEERAKR
jgi:hypothetical protein